MTRLSRCLDRLNIIEYFVFFVSISDKNIDKLLRIAYNQCRKNAITGVGHGSLD